MCITMAIYVQSMCITMVHTNTDLYLAHLHPLSEASPPDVLGGGGVELELRYPHPLRIQES
jgi:hypothetical protein